MTECENFFVGITLLQIKIILKIIQKKKLKKNNCILLYYSTESTKSERYYLSKIKPYCKKIILMRNKIPFPFYFFEIKKKFKNYLIKNAYISNINGIYDQYLMSVTKPNRIFTFDDGAGNLYKNTKYNIGEDFNYLRKVIYYLLGNRYSTNRFIRERVNHFTIFKNNKNYSSKKIIKLNLFRMKEITSLKKMKECNIILGTVINEYFLHIKNKFLIKDKVKKFIKNSGKSFFYIKHPRGQNIDNLYFDKLKIINSKKIAEDFIIEELLTKYKIINLYGFPVSTAQINLEGFKNVNNFILHTDNLPQRALDGMKTLKKYKTIKI